MTKKTSRSKNYIIYRGYIHRLPDKEEDVKEISGIEELKTFPQNEKFDSKSYSLKSRDVV